MTVIVTPNTNKPNRKLALKHAISAAITAISIPMAVDNPNRISELNFDNFFIII